jgi:hypothetical protein
MLRLISHLTRQIKQPQHFTRFICAESKLQFTDPDREKKYKIIELEIEVNK